MSAVAFGNNSASGKLVTSRAYEPALRKIEPGKRNQLISTVNIKNRRPILSKIAHRLLEAKLQGSANSYNPYLDKKQP